MKLAISLATRSRPDRLIETVNRSRTFWTNPNTVLWLMVDEDDAETRTALDPFQKRYEKHGIHVSVGPREDTTGEKWNRIVRLCPDADVYLPMADDDPFITPGYDEKILEAASIFPDGYGLVYGQMANQTLPGINAPTTKLARAMGGIYPEFFPFWGVDQWNDDIAKLIGRISYADVEADKTRPGQTIGLRDLVWWMTWFDAAFPLRVKIAEKILNASDFVSPSWRKELLACNAALVQQNSMITSNYHRGMADKFEKMMGVKPDERYMRVYNKAKSYLPMLEQQNLANPHWQEMKSILFDKRAA